MSLNVLLDLYPVRFSGISTPWLYAMGGILLLTVGAAVWLTVTLFRRPELPEKPKKEPTETAATATATEEQKNAPETPAPETQNA